MSDRRLTPANGRVAAAHLRGRVAALAYRAGEPARLAAPLADLCRAPDGPRDRQVLKGAALTVYDRVGGWAFVQAGADGYVGYLREAALTAPGPAPTHRVAARATHLYPAPDFKTRERAALSLGAELAVTGRRGRFAETPEGFVPEAHLAPLDRPETDPVAVAERLLGTPYLWGGNSAWGIDCSGLVQAALRACGRACPGDSDLQEAAGLGRRLDPGAVARRGDLLFWRGHVGWVAGDDLLLHANAHHMAVAFEPLAAACARIAAQGDGAVTAHLRPDPRE
ncbi:C40 family peptidase [Roseivivax sp. CAU 1761]